MKVSVVHNTSPLRWPQAVSPLWVLAILFGVTHHFAFDVTVAVGDDATTDNEEVENPLDKLTGLLDPSLAKPLMTVAEEKDFRARKEANYMRTALKSLGPNNKIEAEIQEGVQFRVLRLTMPENWPNMGNRTKDLITDLDVFADGAPRAREIAARAAVKELDALLFSDQPKVVKINAAALLGRLNIESINRRTKTPPVPFAPAAEPLVKALNDSQLGLDVKSTAVRGLKRIMEDGDPSRQQRDAISKAMVDQLNGIESLVATDEREWYQWRLVDALGTVEFPRTMTQQTYVVDALWKTMHDNKLPWHIRTRAARSLGQLKLDTSFNIPLLVHEIVLLAGKMTGVYNQNPDLPYWRLCFTDLYFAFKAQDPRQQARGWGLLQNPPAASRAMIEGAYQVVLPIVNAVMRNVPPQAVPVNLLQDAVAWMRANEPADKKIHAEAAPLAPPKPAEVPGAGSTNVTPPPTSTEPVATGP